MTTVQGIEFEINGSADNATQSVEHLVKILIDLRGSMSASASATASASSRLKSIAKTARSLKNVLSSLKRVASGVSKVLQFSAPTRAMSAFGGVISGLANRLKRLVIMRTFRAMIRAVTQAFKEGINNLYEYSRAINGEFAASLDQASTSLLYLKNSIGAMVAPLINALAPALDIVIDKVVTFLNAINQLFAKLTGASYWTRAKKAATTYGDAVSDAIGGTGSAAKEALRYLAPWDEINKFDSDSGGGGGGGSGGGASTPNYGEMFEEMVEFNEELSNFVDKLKEAWENADFTEIGRVVGTKIRNALDHINWVSIQETCGRVATSIATFINGVVETPGWWQSVGRAIGNAINTAVGTINTFFDTTHWVSIGSGVATAINNAISTIDAYELGRALTQKISALIQTAYGFVTTLNWHELGTSIGNMIQGAIDDLDLEMLGSALGDAILGLLDTATTSLDTVDWSSAGEKLAEGINSLTDKLKDADVGGFIVSLASALTDFVIAAVENIDWLLVGLSILDGINSVINSAYRAITGDDANLVRDFTEDYLNNGYATGSNGKLTSTTSLEVPVVYTPTPGDYLNQYRAQRAHNEYKVNLVFQLATLDGSIDRVKQDTDNLIREKFDRGVSVSVPFSVTKFSVDLDGALDRAKRETDDIIKEKFAKGTSVSESTITIKKFSIDLGKGLDRARREMDEIIKEKIKDGPSIQVPAEAEIQSVDPKGIKPGDKKISGFTAETVSFRDKIPSGNKLLDATANFVRPKDSLGVNQRILPTTAQFSNKPIDSLTAAQKTFSTTSKFTNVQDAIPAQKMIFVAVAKFASVVDAISTAGRTFKSIAQFVAAKDSMPNSSRIINTIANYVKAVDNLGSGYKTINVAIKPYAGWKGSLAKYLGIETLTTTLKLYAPVVGVNWKEFWWMNTKYYYPGSFYTKYYAKGGILDAETLLGFANGNAHVAGESGKEAILPLESNTWWMDALAEKTADAVAKGSNQEQDMTINLVVDGNVLATTTVNTLRRQARAGLNPLVGVV